MESPKYNRYPDDMTKGIVTDRSPDDPTKELFPDRYPDGLTNGIPQTNSPIS